MNSSSPWFDITNICRPVSARICLLLGFFLIMTSCVSWSSTLSCSRCGKPIQNQSVTAGQLQFHPGCMTCAYCGLPIQGKFTLIGNEPYHPDCHISAKNLVCAYCNKPLKHKWMESDGKKYHPDCFKNHIQLRCGICGKPIEGHYIRDDGAYHEQCYKETKLDRCVVCSRPIEDRHLVDPWGNKAHVDHNGHPVEICGSCGRILSPKGSKGSFRYSDGRTICGVCRETAVTDLKRIGQLTTTVKSLLSTVGIDGFPAAVPLSLVDLDELKDKSGKHYNNSARGITLSMVMMRKDAPAVTSHTIHILEGLPLTEFKAVLAHELLHVWLIENGIDLPDKETEGFCNLGAMLVNQNENTAFSKVLLSQLETNPDPVYGDGYRHMKNKLDLLNWSGLIRELLSGR